MTKRIYECVDVATGRRAYIRAQSNHAALRAFNQGVSARPISANELYGVLKTAGEIIEADAPVVAAVAAVEEKKAA